LDQILSYGNNVDGKIYYSGNLRATTTPFIIQELKRLAENSKNGKVSIVAHSNGGLVAKALLKKLADNNDPLLQKIDKLFLVAVPQVGTPEAVGALLHGFEQAHFPVIDAEHARILGKNMPGAYQLLPSDSYWSGIGGEIKNSPIIFNTTDFDPIVKAVDKYGLFVNTKEKLFNFLKGAEIRIDALSDDLSSPSVLNSNLLSYAENIHSQIDNWIPPANITVHQIAGWGEETLGSIIYSKKNECEELVSVGDSFYCNKYKKVWTYDPDMVIDGDGTVVTPSALFMSTSSPNVKRWWVDLRSYNDSIFDFKRKHKDILEVPSLIDFVKNKNQNKDLTLDFILENQPNYLVDEKRLNFVLHSPLDLFVTDINGKKVSSTTSEIPNARYFRMGEIQYVSVPGESKPTVNLFGNGKGSFDLKVEEKEGLNIVSTTTFSSIPSSEKTVATINFENGEIRNAGPLKVDYQGDGKYDLELKLKIDGTVTSPILDTIPPEVQIIFSTSTNRFKFEPIDENSKKIDSNILNNSAVFKDEKGNSLRVLFSEFYNNKNNESRFEIKNLLYATSSVSSPV
jgi:pimeloyl-ACP methyl ester carboxylesterase